MFASFLLERINAGRIARRVMEGGHDVPIPKIISRYSKSIANCCIVSKMVDRVYVYDNSIEFAEPTLLFRVTDGVITKEYATHIQGLNRFLILLKNKTLSGFGWDFIITLYSTGIRRYACQWVRGPID